MLNLREVRELTGLSVYKIYQLLVPVRRRGYQAYYIEDEVEALAGQLGKIGVYSEAVA